MSTRKEVNHHLIEHLQTRLEEVDDEQLKEKSQQLHQGDNVSNVHQLLGFFESKMEEYSQEADTDDRRPLLNVFEEAIQKSLMTTKKSEQYDDFADLAVLYFIRESDREGWGTKDIEQFLRRL